MLVIFIVILFDLILIYLLFWSHKTGLYVK